MMAAIAVAGSVWARGNSPQTGIDISAIMTSTDISNLPVHNITDAY